MDFIKLLLVVTLASLIPGQLIRIPTGALATITATDASVLVLTTVFFIYSFAFGKRLYMPKGIITLFIVFNLFALTSTILASSRFALNEILSALLFHIRFIAYFMLSIVVINVIKESQITKWANLVISLGIVFTTCGFLQVIFVPDLLFLAPYGWDPHQKRLVSTLLDPNFTGGVLVIISSISAALFLFQKNYIYLVATAIYFIGIVLTFSRSSYLALIVLLIVIGFLKSPKFLLGFLSLFILVVLVNSQSRERITSAITIDETVQARLESYSKAVTIYRQNPIFGVGFNTYRYAQSQFGFFGFDDPMGGHSGAGSDSSLLLVAATTGTIGAVTLILFIIAIFKKIIWQSSKNYIKLAALSAFSALIIHTQFVNSFFYPQIMVLIWFLFGLAYVSENS